MSDGMLSQEEIDALLKGENLDSEPDSVKEDLNIEENTESKKMGEKEELDEEYLDILTEVEIDALGEIGNISMGTAATTLATLLNQKVNITTPTVEITTSEKLAQEYEAPLVAVDVSYSKGLEGSNIMMLRTDDVKIITDLMMGKEEVDTDRELTEIDLSAVSEAMNQMMGSSATSLSSMLDKQIDIKPPISEKVVFSEDKKKIDLLKDDGPLIKISFKMEIGEYIDSNIMQLLPIEFGKNMIETLMANGSDSEETIEEKIEGNIVNEESVDKKPEEEPVEEQQETRQETRKEQTRIHEPTSYEEDPVVVSKPEFKSFEKEESFTNGSEIDLVGDIPVEITVELGRTSKKIGEILEFGMGTIVELDKLVGEPLKVLANGKYIASGEVVVIDDSFGVRITDIERNKKIL